MGVGLLATTTATSLIACNNKTTDKSDDKENEKNNDLEILNEIIKIAKTSFQTELFKEIVLGDTPDLLKSYEWVNKKIPSLTLQFSNPNHAMVINYFIAMFQLVYNNVNQQIINKYPNYYMDSVPLEFSKTDAIITLNFIDLKQINQELGLQIAGAGIEQIKAVKIDFNLKYNVKFKTLTSLEEFPANFNMMYNVRWSGKKQLLLNKKGCFFICKTKIINWFRERTAS